MATKKPKTKRTKKAVTRSAARALKLRKAPCGAPCTKVVKFMTDREIGPNVGISLPPYKKVDGYRHLNLFVHFSQAEPNEPPVDLGVMFAFDKNGALRSRRYVNLEENVAPPQGTNMITVSGSGAFHGAPPGGVGISAYNARLPVMGPFVQVFVYNQAAHARTVSVWGYLVS